MKLSTMFAHGCTLGCCMSVAVGEVVKLAGDCSDFSSAIRHVLLATVGAVGALNAYRTVRTGALRDACGMKTVTITQEQLAAAITEWEQTSRDEQWPATPEDSPAKVGEDSAAYLFPLLEQKTA